MKIEQYLNLEQLVKHIEEGLVDNKQHSTLPLNILTYSRKTVYEDAWDDTTEKCRGLIVDNDGNIISRPFPKFFNISTSFREETWITNLPKEKPQTLEKLDGSLGILYTYEGVSAVASKGSFSSEHALWATKWYNEHCKNAQWPEGYTVIFEMICQEVQTHVVHYDTVDQLVLLALINNETGEEASYENLHYWGTLNEVNVVDIHDKTMGTVLNEDRANTEGYVLSWPNPGKPPTKVKIKHESFLVLQKIVHNATPKTILQALAEGKAEEVDKWMNTKSEELNQFVRGWFARFSAAFADIMVASSQLLVQAKLRFTTRKEIAEFFLADTNKIYAPVCFAMMDGKEYKKIIWKILKDSMETSEDIFFMKEDDEDDGDKE